MLPILFISAFLDDGTVDMPRASVVIPVYNSAHFVRSAYDSLAAQTLTDLEMIFVNDGSEDETLSLLNSLAVSDSRVKVIDLGSNFGSARARNAAFEIAEGEWIAVLDADDGFRPERLEVLIHAAEQKNADIVMDNLYIVDPISKQVVSCAFAPKSKDSIDLHFSEYLSNIQSKALYDFGFLKPVIRRSWLNKNNVRYVDTLRFAQDVVLILECYAHDARVILLSKPYYYYNFPFSLSKKLTSAKRRTQTRYHPVLAATEEFLKKYQAKLSPRDQRLLRSRCEGLREAILVDQLRSYLASSDYAAIIRCLEHPIRFARGVYFEKRRHFLRKRREQAFLAGRINL